MSGYLSINTGSGHVDPSKFSLRELARIRGAMWTVRGPWRFGPRPGDPSNITALEYIYSYGDNPTASPFRTGLNKEQSEMLATYKAGNYTHLAFGPTNAESYHGQYPDYSFDSPASFDVWLDWLQVFWDHGLAPVCFLHGDGETFEQTQARMEPLIKGNPRAQKLMRIVIPTGWEPAKYEWSSNTWALFCQWIGDLLPNALVGIHTVADVDAPVGTDSRGDDNGKPNGEGWSRVAPHIHLWFIQNGAYTGSTSELPSVAREFGAQFMPNGDGAVYHGPRWHFVNGIDGWPTFSKWGNEPIYLINAECTSYEAYWHNLPYDSSKSWGDLAIQSGADGYLDSGNLEPPKAKG